MGLFGGAPHSSTPSGPGDWRPGLIGFELSKTAYPDRSSHDRVSCPSDDLDVSS